MWSDYGENSRALKWVIERACGDVKGRRNTY
ncbi:MAG: hypothetical protein ACUZ8N_13210 [Candidatus Scalindua sp.]